MTQRVVFLVDDFVSDLLAQPLNVVWSGDLVVATGKQSYRNVQVFQRDRGWLDRAVLLLVRALAVVELLELLADSVLEKQNQVLVGAASRKVSLEDGKPVHIVY